MGYGSKGLNDLRDEALRIATEHGFTEASVGEDVALIHSEASELLEDHREHKAPTEVWYENRVRQIFNNGESECITIERSPVMYRPDQQGPLKPCGIPSECADIIIRVLHFCGKHDIDIEQAVREKMIYNESRPLKHGKTL